MQAMAAESAGLPDTDEYYETQWWPGPNRIADMTQLLMGILFYVQMTDQPVISIVHAMVCAVAGIQAAHPLSGTEATKRR